MPLILGPLRFTVGTVVSDTGTIYANIMARSKEKCKNLSAFGNRLKVLMEERQLTQEQVASAVGVSRAAVGTWLHGTIPGARELFILAKFLEKPMESFFDAIPYVKPPAEALYVDPPGGVSISHLSAEWRKFYAGMFETMSTPEGREAFKQTFNQLFPGANTVLATHEEIAKQVLTDVVPKDNIDAMQEQMQRLRDRLRRATEVRGQKAALARWLGVSMSSVSTWLAGAKKPSGETTLRLLQWVEQQERQKNKSADSVSAPPAPKTQSKVPNEKKPQSGWQKE